MANKRIQDLPAKGATIAANDILEVSEYQSPGVYTSKKILGSELGGVTTFTALTDTPASYTGQTLKFVRVNAGETALEFATVSVSDTNIANTQLTLPTGTRKLIFGGANSTDILAFRNSTDTLSILEVRGDNKVVFGNSLTSFSIVVSNTAYGKQLSSYDSFASLKYRFDTDEGRVYASNQILVASVDGTGDGIKLIKGGGGARNIKIDDQFSTNYLDISVNTSTALSTFYLRTASDNNNVFTTFRSAGVGYDHNLTISNRASLAIGGTTFDNGSKYTLNMFNGTAPTTNITDAYQQYSSDITAGNAAPHFRTEAGDVIKLYKQASAGITTVADLVTVLTNLGLLG